MTIENGAEQAANDTALPDDQTEQAAEAPQEVEVEYEGKTYCVPAELKDALLRLFVAAATAVQLSMLAFPDSMRAWLPDGLTHLLAVVLLAAAVFGRLVDQKKRA